MICGERYETDEIPRKLKVGTLTKCSGECRGETGATCKLSLESLKTPNGENMITPKISVSHTCMVSVLC